MEGACRVFEASITEAFIQEGLGSLHEDIRDEIEHKKRCFTQPCILTTTRNQMSSFY